MFSVIVERRDPDALRALAARWMDYTTEDSLEVLVLEAIKEFNGR